MSKFGPNAHICSFLRLKVARLSHVGIILMAELESTLHFPVKAKVHETTTPFHLSPSITATILTLNIKFVLERSDA